MALAQAQSLPRLPERESAFMAGGLGTVERWVEESGLSLDGAVSSLNQEFAYLNWARLLITQDQGGPALKLLARLQQSAENGDRTGRVIEVLALKALALQTLGDAEQALFVLQNALSLAEPEGYVRLFVDEGIPMAALLHKAAARGIAPIYANKLLAAFGVGEREIAAPPLPPSAPSPLPREPLSDRELEVLRWLSTDLSAPEIATELVVSVNTVRTHIKHIYSKLDAHSRYQAVERARELDLL
jgi:LuxR family maltose regulon positive regulatory protein